MKQFEFSFTQEDEKNKKTSFENLTDDEIVERYIQTFRVNPKYRGIKRPTMIDALLDPPSEEARLLALDKEDDKRQLKINRAP